MIYGELMGLSLKDRFKALKRTLRVICDPKTNYVNLLWEIEEKDTDGENKINTHTFYKDGQKPFNPLLVYMARVAGYSENLEEVNAKTNFYLNKVAVAFMLFNPSKQTELQYVANPIVEVKKESDQEDLDENKAAQES